MSIAGAADLPTPDRRTDAGCGGAGGGQTAQHADGEVGEGLRLQHIAVQAGGLHRFHRAGDTVGQHLHQRGIQPATASDEDPGGFLREMFSAPRHGYGNGRGKGGCSIGVAQMGNGIKQGGEIVPIQ